MKFYFIILKKILEILKISKVKKSEEKFGILVQVGRRLCQNFHFLKKNIEEFSNSKKSEEIN